jgi:formylglycine-generating enzyme required for sulfatase activity
MDFVTIGNPNNAADTTGSPNPVGSVAYTYNIGKYEVSRDMVLKASTAGGLGLTLADMTSYGGNSINKPATGIRWYEAAKFVNWLNTSKGYQAAYLFDGSGNYQIWSSVRAAQNNLFRHKDAQYFLPSMDEWYKAAYGNSSGAWFNYPNGTDFMPTMVSGGTASGSAVYMQTAPADVRDAGGLSAFGTMAQGGNVREWVESAFTQPNDLPDETRGVRGGYWNSWLDLGSLANGSSFPTTEDSFTGFRVAMIPEPPSLPLLALGGVGVALGRRRK